MEIQEVLVFISVSKEHCCPHSYHRKRCPWVESQTVRVDGGRWDRVVCKQLSAVLTSDSEESDSCSEPSLYNKRAYSEIDTQLKGCE